MNGSLQKKLAAMKLTRLERKFYNPNATTYSELFHKQNVSAGLISQDKDLLAHAKSFGIGEADDSTQIVYTVNEPLAEVTNKVHIVCFPIEHQKQAESFALQPKQSYLRFGPIEFSDIAEQRFCCIEIDKRF